MRNQGFDYYIHDGPAAFRLQLVGVIDRDGARRLEQVWHTAAPLIMGKSPIIDITFVTTVEHEARELLLRWREAGGQFVANSKASRTLAESIFGAQLSQAEPKRSWLPVRRCFFKSAVSLPLLIAALLFTFPASAANLKPETVAAWDDYVDAARADLQRRISPDSCFLWTFENAERAAKVHAGEIVVAPAPGADPKKVSGGLIHHWIGAMFLPDVTMEQVMNVTRDYDRYKDYYQPAVIESAAIARGPTGDQFSMKIMNRAFFLKTALDADYQATYVRLDDNRMYSISRTTRLQEIEDFGEPDEHEIPEGAGGGYIWKLFSIARFEQRDAGVYVELEAIALSREIPLAARFFVDPIVRRVSRNSMLISLRQTREALCGNDALSARHNGIPAGNPGAGHVRGFLAK
jgi:hypothetical protein